MRQLSHWARVNPWKARLLIIGGQVATTCLAIWLGTLFLEERISLHAGWFFAFACAFFASILVYPSRGKRKSLKAVLAYRWQKSCDFALMLFSFCMITCLANQASISLPFPDAYAAHENLPMAKGKTPTAEEILASLKYRDKSTLTKAEKRILRKEFKKQLKIYAKAKLNGDKEDADKTLLIILAIVAAVGLFILLSTLACSISCGGAEGLAIVVMVLGTGALIVGTIFLIRAIQRGGKRPPKKEDTALQ